MKKQITHYLIPLFLILFFVSCDDAYPTPPKLNNSDTTTLVKVYGSVGIDAYLLKYDSCQYIIVTSLYGLAITKK